MHRPWFLICSILLTIIVCVQCDTKFMKTRSTTAAEEDMDRTVSGGTTPFCPEQLTCTATDVYYVIPYVADCTKYIYCAPDGTEFVISCNGTDEFSPTENICVAPELAGCPKCSEMMTTTDSFCPPQPECTPADVYLSIPYYADCTKYIYCSPTGPLIVDCPTGLEYSEAEKICVDPTLANCPKCLTTPGDATTTPAMTTPHCLEQADCVSPDNDYQTIPYAANCTQYVYCEPGGVSLILDCPAGLHYSPTVNTCMAPELAGCPQCIETTTLPPTTPFCPTQERCTPETETDTLPYVIDCTKYIYCQLDGSETIMDCPGTLHYSPTVHTCVEAEMSGCPRCSDIISSTMQESTTTTIKDTTTTAIPDTTTTVTGTTGTGVTLIPTTPYCPSQPFCTLALAGTTLPYIGDCTMYIFCLSDGTEELRDCPVPQQYSPFESKCMAPELAQCPKC